MHTSQDKCLQKKLFPMEKKTTKPSPHSFFINEISFMIIEQKTFETGKNYCQKVYGCQVHNKPPKIHDS